MTEQRMAQAEEQRLRKQFEDEAFQKWAAKRDADARAALSKDELKAAEGLGISPASYLADRQANPVHKKLEPTGPSVAWWNSTSARTAAVLHAMARGGQEGVARLLAAETENMAQIKQGKIPCAPIPEDLR